MSAPALTYDSLLSDVQTYAERTDDPFVSQIPRFVMLAENRLAADVKGLGFQQYATGTLNGSVLAKPERWRETISFNVTVPTIGRVFLQPRTYDYCRAFSPDDSVTGQPRYYGDYAYEHFLIAPAPNAACAFELAYYERPEPLSTSNQTNWTTRYAPQLLLYATLIEAQPFLKRADLMSVWAGLYDKAMSSIANEATRRVGADRAATSRNGE